MWAPRQRWKPGWLHRRPIRSRWPIALADDTMDCVIGALRQEFETGDRMLKQGVGP